MEALRIHNLPSTSFLCSKSLPSSSPSRRSLRTQLACQPSTSLRAWRFSAIVAGDSSADADAKMVASENAVEGVNQQLHETARNLSHDGVEKTLNLEARADAESEEASAHASAQPNSSEHPNDNVGSGHEEGWKAAEKMTPKAN